MPAKTLLKTPELIVAATPEPAHGLRYIGTGGAWPGLPMRDMTADECAALAPECIAAAIDAGLYTPDATPQESLDEPRT